MKKHGDIGFRDKDINYVTSRSSYTSSNRMTRSGYANKEKFRRDSISTSPDGSSASKTKLKSVIHPYIEMVITRIQFLL